MSSARHDLAHITAATTNAVTRTAALTYGRHHYLAVSVGADILASIAAATAAVAQALTPTAHAATTAATTAQITRHTRRATTTLTRAATTLQRCRPADTEPSTTVRYSPTTVRNALRSAAHNAEDAAAHLTDHPAEALACLSAITHCLAGAITALTPVADAGPRHERTSLRRRLHSAAKDLTAAWKDIHAAACLADPTAHR